MNHFLLRLQVTRLALIAGIFAPSIFMMAFHASSLSTGLLLVLFPLVIWNCINVCLKGSFFETKISLGICFFALFLISHFVFTGLVFSLVQDSARFYSSLFAVAIMLASSALIGRSLNKLNGNEIEKIIKLIFSLFLLCAIFSFTGIDIFGNSAPKPVLLFPEPSHFSLAVAPFVIYYIFTRQRTWLIVLIFFFLWAFYIENVTMLAVLMLVVIVSFNVRGLIVLIPLAVLLFLSFADFNYFADRLILSSDNTNQSALVLMQGWENALLTMRDTNWLGVGLQQFGVASSSGEITEKLSETFLVTLNQFDGGSTISKLMGEFGFFGLILVFILLRRAISSFRALKGKTQGDPLIIFSHCVNIGIFVEIMVRGVGYFSPGIFIYLVMLLACNRINEKNGAKKTLSFIGS